MNVKEDQSHYIPYPTNDILVQDAEIFSNETQVKLLNTADRLGTNKLQHQGYEESSNGDFNVSFDSENIYIPYEAQIRHTGGNVHNVLAARERWAEVAGITKNTNVIVDPQVQRTGFWVPITSNKTSIERDISLGEDYNKQAIKSAVDNIGLTNGGRIYTELYRHDVALGVEQIIIPSSKCAQELTQGLKERRIYPCVSGQELRHAGIDTHSVDWSSDKAVKDFVNNILPEKRRYYQQPQLLGSFQIGDNSIGVYGIGEERIIATSLLDRSLQQKLTEGRSYTSKPAIKGGRGDAQVGGRDVVTDLFEVLDHDINHAIRTSMKLSLAGAGLVHVNDTPNLAGIKDKDLQESYDWAKHDSNDYPVRLISA